MLGRERLSRKCPHLRGDRALFSKANYKTVLRVGNALRLLLALLVERVKPPEVLPFGHTSNNFRLFGKAIQCTNRESAELIISRRLICPNSRLGLGGPGIKRDFWVAVGNRKARNALKYLVRWEEFNLSQPRKKAFRVNRIYPEILRSRKQRITRRLDPQRRWSDQPGPVFIIIYSRIPKPLPAS